jgi:hypothetical protein
MPAIYINLMATSRLGRAEKMGPDDLLASWPHAKTDRTGLLAQIRLELDPVRL